MSQNDNSPEGKQPPYHLYVTMASVAWQVGCAALAIVLVALVGGLWLDKQFGVKPLFTILLLVASGPVSMYVIYRLAMRAASQANALMKPGLYKPGNYDSKEDNE
jgi:hypothetical protein